MRFLKSMALIFVINVYVKAATVITPRFDQSKSDQVNTLKITTLSTMLADKGIGEWGYAALIEVDGHKILFDTGNKPKTVLQNALDLNIDLSDVEDVFLSHNHSDHTGGVVDFKKSFETKKSESPL
jgi:7,8-dihydropterin-6-yl-methyl-4-(beta-D-ribofuranosyl)aminobenzene 5'-phosphate synthase